jgi:hypothetical protein
MFKRPTLTLLFRETTVVAEDLLIVRVLKVVAPEIELLEPPTS